jgi:hypothetical protein
MTQNITCKDICKQTQIEFLKQYQRNAVTHPSEHKAAFAHVKANQSTDWLDNQANYWAKFNQLVEAKAQVAA